MEDRYRFSYAEESVYGQVMRLLRAHAEPPGYVVDLGCGFGAIAEPCRAAGFDYLGVDADDTGPKDLSERGFTAVVCDVEDGPALEQTLTDHLGDGHIAAVALLDTIEHVSDPGALLDLIRRLSRQHSGVPLVVSVPNVSHLDVAVKLLLGRWDVTSSGLLDETHRAFYSARRLAEFMGEHGWSQLAASDYELRESDQHFPRDLVTLSTATPINALLRSLRERGEPGSNVNQFVRAYVPGVRRPPASHDVDTTPFLTVLTRTQGRRLTTLHDTLLCLAAQTCDDFEVLVLCHDTAEADQPRIDELVGAFPAEFARRVRVVPVRGGGRSRPLNAGVAEARGRYIAVIDDDDLVLAHWVEEFRRLEPDFPGRIMRAVVGEQDIRAEGDSHSSGYTTMTKARCPYPVDFNLFDHMVDNLTPLCGLAFPRSMFAEFGLTFDEDLPVLEDWDLLLQAALFCGMVETAEVTSVYRRWTRGTHSLWVHSASEWAAARQTILDRLDRRFLLMPPGTVARVRAARTGELTGHDAEVRYLRNLLGEADQRLGEVVREFRTSTSWRASVPIRIVGNLVKRAQAARTRRSHPA